MITTWFIRYSNFNFSVTWPPTWNIKFSVSTLTFKFVWSRCRSIKKLLNHTVPVICYQISLNITIGLYHKYAKYVDHIGIIWYETYCKWIKIYWITILKKILVEENYFAIDKKVGKIKERLTKIQQKKKHVNIIDSNKILLHIQTNILIFTLVEFNIIKKKNEKVKFASCNQMSILWKSGYGCETN